MEQPAAVPQPYVRSQWQAGTPQPRPGSVVNIQVDSNGPWRHAYPLGDNFDWLFVEHGKTLQALKNR